MLHAESDRGLALVGATTLDLCLEDLLRRHFIGGKALADRLLGVDRPLGLGLITKSTKPRSVKDTNTYWTMTPFGDTVMTRLRAIRRNVGEA